MSKIVERIILQRLRPDIDSAIPLFQTDFRPSIRYYDQTLVLDCHIENKFNDKIKLRAAFVDLKVKCSI